MGVHVCRGLFLPLGAVGYPRLMPKSGGAFRMTDAEWARWIALFREHPGETVKVAKLMGVPRNRARIAWYHGWPKHGKPAISELLEQDKTLARAHRASVLEKEATADVEITPAVQELAKKTDADVTDAIAKRKQVLKRLQDDSIRTRAEEGMLIDTSRKNALALAGLTINLIKGAQQLAKRLEVQLRSDVIPAREAMSLIKGISNVVRMNTDASLQVIEMERRIMGEPAPDVKAGGRFSPDEAAEHIALAVKAMEKYQQRQQALRARNGDSDAGSSQRLPGQTIVVHADPDDDDDTADVAEPSRLRA